MPLLQHIFRIPLCFVVLLWSLQTVAADLTNPQSTNNTPPQILEGDRIEVILKEDNSHQSSAEPKPYAILLTASDAQHDKLSWAIATEAQHGTITMTGSNNVQTVNYTPDPHYHGVDGFTVQVADIFNNVDTINVYIMIRPINDSPSALRAKDINVAYGSPLQAYRLDKYFYDVDNERHELRYEVTENTHPNVVRPKVRDNFLELTYKQAGESKLMIKAIDPHGLYATTLFYVEVAPIESTIEVSHSFPPLSQIGQPVVLFFQVKSPSAIDPTGLVTISNGLQSCHYRLKTEHRGKGLCRLTLSEYQDHMFYAEYAGDNNFMPSTTQQAFVHSVRPKVLVYHTKPRSEYELSEDGLGDSYAISLSQTPINPVELTLTPDKQLSINDADIGQAVTLTLIDTQPTEITLIPTDDELVEGWHYGAIRHQTQSADADYHNLRSNLQFPIQDNDAGIVIKQSNGGSELVEEETTDHYAIYLSTVPQKPVNIKIEPYDNQSMVYPNNLLFDTETWYKAQNIQISAVPDTELEGEHTSMLFHSIRTQDIIYADENIRFNIDGDNTNTVDVAITDNDAEQPPLMPSDLTAKLLEDNQVFLQWQDNSDNEERFVLKRDGLKLAVLPENARYYQDIEVRCHAVYQYELFSVNKKGRSHEAAKISVQTAPCSELKPPDNLVSFPIGNQYINLVWNDTNNSEAGYIIERNGREVGRTSAHTVGYRDNSFTCSMKYDYAVKAYGFNGEYSSAAYTSIRTQACTGRFTLTLKIEGGGTVNGCAKECIQIYPEKQALGFKIRALPNWRFDRWEGDCDVEQLVMDADKHCIAYFVES
ncbi:Ig-like domain-containing protein [Candidatus Albibeggiatoa sp. nov. NOAA]|uniref:Ig-like domain-containing protein n=1 Tax=Candidatus Albibeggiatoa sp. nov. NOAA TaxID=3162724 RepID=UPI00330000DE|nr:Ig-like domain-containing protein [Thiotrichaceae bacterium]